MPIDNLSSKNSIEDLYVKFPGGTSDYALLRLELQKVNASIVNQETNTYYDSSYTSYLASDRKQKELDGLPRFLEKKICYGIVLYVTSGETRFVYIDVPGKNHGLLDPDIFYTNSKIDLNIYKEYLFEANSDDWYSIPVVGGIAVVEIPYNFPNHIYTNSEDAIYLSMKRPDIVLSIDDGRKSVRQILSGGGGFMAENRPESTAVSTDPLAPPMSDVEIPGDIMTLVNNLGVTRDGALSFFNISKPRAIPYLECLRDASSKSGISVPMLFAIGAVESQFNPNVGTNAQGASGLGQLTTIAYKDIRLNKLKLLKSWGIHKNLTYREKDENPKGKEMDFSVGKKNDTRNGCTAIYLMAVSMISVYDQVQSKLKSKYPQIKNMKFSEFVKSAYRAAWLFAHYNTGSSERSLNSINPFNEDELKLKLPTAINTAGKKDAIANNRNVRLFEQQVRGWMGRWLVVFEAAQKDPSLGSSDVNAS